MRALGYSSGLVLAMVLPGLVLAQSAARKAEVEADWLLQERERRPISTRDDALGAVDGVKNGSWAFHTGLDNPPWWQVDLGQAHALDHVVIYNRADGAAPRTAHLIVLLSDNGQDWRQVYQHDGETFYGFTDGKPLEVSLTGQTARFLRLQQPDQSFLHLDEVEVYGAADPARNLALWAEADQSSTSTWSAFHPRPGTAAKPVYMLEQALERGWRLAADLRAAGLDTGGFERELAAVADLAERDGANRQVLWSRARWAIRHLAFRNPVLDFDNLVFVKRVPSSFSHMSDQYYGWWSRPGGGVYVLTGLKSDDPQVRCLTDDFAPGSFLEPELSYDGRKVLFAYCRYYPEVAGIADKETKTNLPEDAFYHVFEMNVDGTGLRQLTQGRYDDFSARYLPSGDILFLSTRRGQFIRTGPASAQATLTGALGDCYVRCGGDPYRPVAVYTLHVMDADGGGLHCISPFENFEWTPSVMPDGRIMYSRWDYVDRSNMPYMKLWSVNPDGTNPRALWGMFTTNPHCTFEARCVPNSQKILFTASAHHAVTAGSLVLLDPLQDLEGQKPMTRLTPEVCFPETEGWPMTYYVSPYPLSERYYLTGWSPVPIISQGGAPAENGPGLYLYDAFGNLELIYRDPDIGCMSPQPLRPHPRPPVVASAVDWQASSGSFLLQDVYRGLTGIAPGTVKWLRVVGVPPKTQPNMNTPNLGVTADDPGKYVLGTVPVQADGSAYFRAPAGTNVFFQALDAEGLAVQTMRTVTTVQPNQTLSCVGCHESRAMAPLMRRPAALAQGASKITPGPEGSWPLRYERLVQPVLDRRCASCHQPQGPDPEAAAYDLSEPSSYDRLISWGTPSLADHVRQCYNEGRSVPGNCEAQQSPLLRMLRQGHHDVALDADDLERLATWMDTYAQRRGAFSDDQEQRLARLREDAAPLLAERPQAQ
mgnify:FL=1